MTSTNPNQARRLPWRLECSACGNRWGAGCERKAYQSAEDHSRRLGAQHVVRVDPPKVAA